MSGRLHVGSAVAESLPSGWHDEIVVHTISRTKKRSITVMALVNVYDEGGRCYSGEHVMRLCLPKGGGK